MRILAAVALVALLGSPALAQAPGAVEPQAAPVQRKDKDPAIGVALAIVGSLGSVALAEKVARTDGGIVPAISMLVLGPSIGQWYSKQVGVIGISMRVSAAYLLFRAVDDYEHDEGYILGALGLWVGSTLYDLWAAYDAAGTYNREQSLRFAPTMMQAAKGHAPGVAASLSF